MKPQRHASRLFSILVLLVCAALAAQTQQASAQQLEPERVDDGRAEDAPDPPPRPDEDDDGTRVVVDTWVPNFLDDKYDESGPTDPDEGMPWQSMGSGGGGGGGAPSSIDIPTTTPPPSNVVDLPQVARTKLAENGFPGLASDSWSRDDSDPFPPPWSAGDQLLLDQQGIGFLQNYKGWQPVLDTGSADIEGWALFSPPDNERSVVVWFDRRCECGPTVLLSVENQIKWDDQADEPWAGEFVDRRFTRNFGPINTQGPDGTEMAPGDGYYEDSRWPDMQWYFSEIEMAILHLEEPMFWDMLDTLIEGNINLNLMIFLNGFEYYLDDEGLLPDYDNGSGYVPQPADGADQFVNWESRVRFAENLQFSYHVNPVSGAYGLEILSPSAATENQATLKIVLDDGSGAEATAVLEFSNVALGSHELELDLFAAQWQDLRDEFPAVSEAKLMRVFFLEQVDLVIDTLIADEVISAQDIQQSPYPTLDMFGRNPLAMWTALPDDLRNWGLDWSPSWDGGHLELQDTQGNMRFLYFDQSNAFYFTDDPVEPDWVAWMTENTWELTPTYTTFHGLGDDFLNIWEPGDAPLTYLAPAEWPELNTGTGTAAADLAITLETRFG